MGTLLDDLRAAGQALDPQFQPSSNEIQGVLAALVHYTELGDEFLKAAHQGAEDVTKLLAPEPPPEPEPAAPAAPASTSEANVSELEKQISDLQAQLASRQATSQQTTVDHETGAGETERAAG